MVHEGQMTILVFLVVILTLGTRLILNRLPSGFLMWNLPLEKGTTSKCPIQKDSSVGTESPYNYTGMRKTQWKIRYGPWYTTLLTQNMVIRRHLLTEGK